VITSHHFTSLHFTSLKLKIFEQGGRRGGKPRGIFTSSLQKLREAVDTSTSSPSRVGVYIYFLYSLYI
jgi:hypothetical protein